MLLGAERSTLGPMADALAEERGRVVGPDPASRSAATSSAPITSRSPRSACPALSISEPREFIGPERRGAEEEEGSVQRQGLPPAERRVRSDLGLHAAPSRTCGCWRSWVARRRRAGDAGYNDGEQFAQPRADRDAVTLTLVTLDDIARRGRAHRAASAPRTPLIEVPWPGAGAGASVLAEVREPAADGRLQDPRRLQHARAAPAEARAARRHHLFVRQPRPGGRAAAQRLGVPAVVVMPTTAPA